MNKPRLLYIAFWYPPSRASGVYRALATTAEFVRSGWDVTVITTTRDFLDDEVGSVDDSLLDFIDPEVEVVRVPFSFGVRPELDVRSLGWWRANFPTAWSYVTKLSTPVRSAMAVMRGATADTHRFNDNYLSWIDPVVKAGLRIHAQHEPDHILATGNPFSAFEAARIISDLTGCPFSVDYRDPWTIDVFTGNMEHANRLTTDAELRVIDQAALSFHVNEPIAKAYRKKYPAHAGKQRVVYNGYDVASIPGPPKPPSGAIRFGILGTVNDRWPLEPIFGAWLRTRASLPEGSELVLGGHLGYFARSRDVIESYLPDESSGFRYVGPVPKAQVADFYASLDVVVLPVPGGPMVTSGKVFEALALGKPIVCVQEEGGGARVLLEGNPLAFPAGPDAAAVGEALEAAAQAAQTMDPQVSMAVRESAEKYERHRAIGEMVAAIESVGRRAQSA